MTEATIYRERVSSKRTTVFFGALTLLFLLLLIRRIRQGSRDLLARIYAGLFSLFLFYSVNYRVLAIQLTDAALTLTFGVFRWRVPLERIATARLDQLPLLMRMGGAGIHGMVIDRRYRASFNFLEHPRVVIAFTRKVGPVQDLSFSTRRPDALLQSLQAAISAHLAAQPRHSAGAPGSADK